MVLARNIDRKLIFKWATWKAGLGKSLPIQKYDMRILENKYKEKDAAPIWKFRNEEDLDQFYTVDDNMMGGRSLVEMSTSKGGRLHMKGKIDPSPTYYDKGARPWDGTGFAGIKSYPIKNVWGNLELSESVIDLHRWQQFEFRVRGDGRPYRIQAWIRNRGGDEVRDTTRFWVAHMQTRGGPYWERIKIPFNRFYPIKYEQPTRLLHKPPMMRLYSLGIFPYEQTPGDFSLEIDSIRAVNTFVDQDRLWLPEHNYKWTLTAAITIDEEILGKYRKSRVYSKHDHILY